MPEISKQEGFLIQLPAKIKLHALEKVIQDKLTGYEIKKGEGEDAKDFAEINSISLAPGKEGFDLSLPMEIVAKTLLFTNKIIKSTIHLKFEYQPELDELSLKNYEFDGEDNGWITNNFLEVLINLLLKKKILNKSEILLKPKIEEFVEGINVKLQNIMKVKHGVLLFGEIKDFKIMNLYFKEGDLILILKTTGVLAAEINEIEL